MEDNNNKLEPEKNSDTKPNEVASDHAKESALTAEGGGGKGPEKSEKIEKPSGGSGKFNKIKEKAGKLGKAKAGLDAAKSPKNAGKQIEKQADKALGRGAKALAIASGIGAFAGRAIQWLVEKIGVRKATIGAVVIILMPIMAFVIIIGYIANNPMEAVLKVLTGPKVEEFKNQTSSVVDQSQLANGGILRRFGYTDYIPGAAIAAPNFTNPKPGSLEEKMTKINLKNAAYQSKTGPGCPYKFTYKEMVGPNGQKTDVIDKVYDTAGREVPDKSNRLVSYCIVNSMPLFNMMIRTETARNVNKFSDTVLNYGDSKDSPNIKGKSNQAIKDYVHQKTYDRITPKTDSTPKLNKADTADNYLDKVNEYIEKVRKQLENPNGNPDGVQFPIEGDPNSDENITQTLCVFSKGYLSKQNMNKAILSRLNAGQRSGVKSNTLASTRGLGLFTNEELSPTFKQLDGWTTSTAYKQNVYGNSGGELINPENLGNAAYGSNFSQAISLLYGLEKPCENSLDAADTSIFNRVSRWFTGAESPKESDRDIRSIYNKLRLIIVAESNGKFSKPTDFGLEQLMIGVIRMNAGAAVSGLETGTQSFNNQSQGFRALANQYMLSIGGRFLSPDETNRLNELTENTTRSIEKRNGIAYRLFDKDNMRSLRNIISYESPRTPSEFKTKGQEFIAAIGNPIKLIADMSSNINYYAMGERNVSIAATYKNGDRYMKLNTLGVPQSEIDSVDIFTNSNGIQDMIEKGTAEQKDVLARFDKCSKSNIPTKNIFVRQYKVNFDENNLAEISNAAKNLIRDDDGLPAYPVVADYGTLGLSDKKDLIACEIYLLNDGYTTRDYPSSKQQELFGFDITDLAKKYRVYLYSNKIADLMVELSSTEKTNSIYQNGQTTASEGGSSASNSTTGAVGDIGQSSDSVPCPPGTNDMGVALSKYTGSRKKDPELRIRLCQIPEIPGNGANSSGAIVSGGAIVNSRVAGAWQALAKAAKADGVNLTASSSFRLFDSCGGTGDGTACARPGQSPHQLGVAIDFGDMSLKGGSSTSCSGRSRLPESPQWSWMFKNAEKFGIEQYSFEAWHWDLFGGGNRCNSRE